MSYLKPMHGPPSRERLIWSRPSTLAGSTMVAPARRKIFEGGQEDAGYFGVVGLAEGADSGAFQTVAV
jgi:hypothetical protein